MIEIRHGLIKADFIDKVVDTDFIVFLSRHSSAKGMATFTTHAEGNWSDDAEFGGRPNRWAWPPRSTCWRCWA